MSRLENEPIKEPKNVDKYDAIFVLPAYPFPQESVGLTFDGIEERVLGFPEKTHPSGLLYDTRLRILAAVLMARRGDSKTIVTMSSDIREYMHDSCAALMEKAVKRLTEKDPVEVIKEEKSYDLLSELQKIGEISEKKGLEDIAIITDRVQAERVSQLVEGEYKFPNYKIVPMEDILTDGNYSARPEQFREIIEKLHSSPYWTFWKLREGVSRLAPDIANRIARANRLRRQATQSLE